MYVPVHLSLFTLHFEVTGRLLSVIVAFSELYIVYFFRDDRRLEIDISVPFMLSMITSHLFYFFPENRLWHFIQIFSLEIVDSFYFSGKQTHISCELSLRKAVCIKCKMSKPVTGKSKKISPFCRLLNLPSECKN